jgi:hypothetical protein
MRMVFVSTAFFSLISALRILNIHASNGIPSLMTGIK